MEVVIATGNTGKIREIRDALGFERLRLLTSDDFELWPEVEETGITLTENALLKARALLAHTGKAALADDSGLLVEALGGQPGIYSSRYGGVEGDSERNMDRLLEELAGVPEEGRGAHFSCVIALSLPDGRDLLAHGECQGRILRERRGTGGFGYDPIFMPEGFDRSMAELSLGEKNEISHRGKAIRAMAELIKSELF